MPFKGDDMPIVNILDLSVASFIAIVEVSGAVKFVDVVAYILHDVDFAASGPISIDALGGHHPKGGPSTAGLGYFQTGFDPAIGPVVFVFSGDAARCYVVVFPGIFFYVLVQDLSVFVP